MRHSATDYWHAITRLKQEWLVVGRTPGQAKREQVLQGRIVRLTKKWLELRTQERADS